MNANLPTEFIASSALLPPDARELLQRAAREAKAITNEVAREAHLEAAIARVRSKFPQYFQE